MSYLLSLTMQSYAFAVACVIYYLELCIAVMFYIDYKMS
jgi:hypothetical protein